MELEEDKKSDDVEIEIDLDSPKDTDDKNKCERYMHLGMKLDRVRNCGERFHMYDLIREPETL